MNDHRKLRAAAIAGASLISGIFWTLLQLSNMMPFFIITMATTACARIIKLQIHIEVPT